MFQLTRFPHKLVLFRNQNACNAGNRWIASITILEIRFSGVIKFESRIHGGQNNQVLEILGHDNTQFLMRNLNMLSKILKLQHSVFRASSTDIKNLHKHISFYFLQRWN